MSKKGKTYIHVDDIVGTRIGKLYVESYYGKELDETSGYPTKVRHWYLCRCDCGNTKLINRSSLTLGLSKSCGCMCKNNGKPCKNHNIITDSLSQ